MDLTSYRAWLFDLDGVITPTAEIHMLAWADMFNDFLTSRGLEDPYTDADYFTHVDGKPRYDGVRDFLASRGISVPEGTPGDDPAQETVCGLGNRKNDAFNTIIERDGVAPYPGSVALLDRLRDVGARLAVVSSSKNAPQVLAAAGLADRFELVVDGTVARDQGLPGKPAPDTYEYAADSLGVAHEQSVVIEDAISGVAAGAAGAFGLVVGVNRGVGEPALTRAGADVVVSDLMELVRP
ncbi:HAD family hydrolase [Tessaracoccus antarcticus]|uniref:Beta-phosphoglucomutase n=1 Tax=Tessaracoccus antarcticus TaxID=2479848 RepID=A0A3M0FXR8_9ACTN|nr:beta-phosphoglucomutase family hydrolase [Tessaracoccus antarcticus]RMB57491.1 beta-phosphoglucomutase family hydrolase [Tessaracoccus antarcticus]